MLKTKAISTILVLALVFGFGVIGCDQPDDLYEEDVQQEDVVEPENGDF
ncbi:hypothetical protein SYNTR_1487 [Candidatus Syntrophocurvum alkaliphilum]|uniref:Uncharacterized protein n=1 Tax=Candidatus Syntrophocurvum alkaliphilum TaxID=2293317 RepID=A0A6I6DIL4_9FIRM|nr:hypothetical protein [Candidatus Syntrophocurvum alkaliphilum]QGU00081.1 hypothetical protein SYNTR_1487 [Candidatus Syntrophocurvum alkaliphilum]